MAYFAGDHSEMLESDVSRHNQLLASFLTNGNMKAYQQSLIALFRYALTHLLTYLLTYLRTHSSILSFRDECGIDAASIGANWKCSHVSQSSLLYNLAVTFCNELKYKEASRLLDALYQALMQEEKSIDAACVGVRLCILWVEVCIKHIPVENIADYTKRVQEKLEQANKWIIMIKSKLVDNEGICSYVELMLTLRILMMKSLFLVHCNLFEHAINELRVINNCIIRGDAVVIQITSREVESNGNDGDTIDTLKSYIATLSPDIAVTVQLLDPFLRLLQHNNSRVRRNWLHHKHLIKLIEMNIEYKQGQYESSVAKLESFLLHCNTNDPALLPCICNNLGSTYTRLRRYYTAVTYYNKAIQLLQLEVGGTSLSVYHDIKYNCGTSYLHLNKPLEALQQFKDILPVMGLNNPSLWLRMAECCIMHDAITRNQSNELVVRSISAGRSRRLLITSTVDTTQHSPTTTANNMSELAGILQAGGTNENCSMQTALTYLNHALLVGKAASTFSSYVEETILVKLMYTHLSLHNPANALIAGDELLKATRTPREQTIYLVKLYSTEALCMLGRADDATRMLNSNEVSNYSLFNGCTIPYSWTIGYQIPNHKLVEVSILLLQAGIHIAAGRYVIAKNILDGALRVAPRFVPTVKTLVYTLLKLGMPTEAAKVLRGYN